ncbi:hypothetical protein ACP4OV_012228 [Aristida adscensionis]
MELEVTTWGDLTGIDDVAWRPNVGVASSGDSSPTDAPSALVLEGLAPGFATTSA